LIARGLRCDTALVTARRIRLDNDQRRSQLIQLGIELFSSHAYDDISIDDLAARAGVSKGLLYHYFDGKRGFYLETLRAASQHLLDLTEPDPSLDPLDQLRSAIDAHIRYVRDYGAVYVTVHRGAMSVAPEVRAILEAHRDAVVRRITRGLGISRPRALLRSALRAWIAMLEGASLDWLDHRDLEPEVLRELLVAGYLAVCNQVHARDPKAYPSTGIARRAPGPRGR
jgi:AcrR family transcriptional regulator